jgi:L-alanine-DL-glutamate epimerase-like enolase superfamily enzyme
MAKAAHKAVTPHVSGGYAAYNMLLFCSVIGNPGHYHEYKNYKGAEDHCEGSLAVKDGRIRIPGGTGLGLDLAFVNQPGGQVVFEDAV